MKSQGGWRIGRTVLAGWLGLTAAGAQVGSNVTVMDLLVVHTPAARLGAGGDTALQMRLEAALLEANLVMLNSRVQAQWHLVGARETPYQESGQVATDLARLRAPHDGFMDEVLPLRDQLGADLVCLVTETGADWDFYGLQGPSAQNAFSVLRRPFLSGYSYLPVALSFNLGCQLERRFADSAAAFPFAYGYSFTGTNGGLFSTVEAFSGTRVPLFSNPDLQCNGVPAGRPAGWAEAADNARVLSLTAPIVAAFRGPAPRTLPPTVNLVAPLDGTPLTDTTSLSLRADAADADGAVQRVDFYANLNWCGAVTNPPGALNLPEAVRLWPALLGVSIPTTPCVLDLPQLPVGEQTLMAVATDNTGAVGFSAPVRLSVRLGNDAFAEGRVLAGSNVTARCSNAAATAEPGEPAHNGMPASHTVWWTWTAPADGPVAVHTRGSSFDTVLACYTGSAVSNLTRVASAADVETEIRFSAQAGTTYHLVVDGWWGEGGDIVLSLLPATPPAPDDFALRAPLHGTEVVVHGSNRYATAQPNEPAHAGQTASHSLWWSWTAPRTGMVALHTLGSSFPTVLAAYTGTALTNLVPVVASAKAEGSEIVFRAQSGTTYQIAADGSSGAVGEIVLNLFYPPPVANDDFSCRISLSGTEITTAATLHYLSHEPGEPEPANSSGRGSAWWTWTAPVAGRVQISAMASHLDFLMLSVYEGTVLSNLNLLANDTSYSTSGGLEVEAGASLQIAVDSSAGSMAVTPGDFTLRLVAVPRPAHDHFLTRQPLSGTHVSLLTSNVAASTESGETGLAYVGPNSVWFSWTAPATGRVTLSAAGHPFGVFTGDSLSQLTSVASSQSGEIQFEAQAGVAYALAVAQWPGEFTLSLVLATARITNPPGGARFRSGSDVVVEVGTTSVDGPVRCVELFQNSQPLVVLSNEPYRYVWPAPPQGDYSLQALVTDQDGVVRRTPPVPVGVAPANDDFARRTPLIGTVVLLTNLATGATKEAGEPNHGGSYGANSLWWSWTAPAAGRVRLGFPNQQYFGVYRGGTVSNLTGVTGGTREGTFEVEAGTEYAIAATGSTAEVVLNLVFSTLRWDGLTNGACFQSGTDLTLNLSTTAFDGSLRRREFFQDGQSLGIVSNAPFTFLWSNLLAGTYVLTAADTDDQAIVRTTPPVSITVLPSNDAFTNAIPLHGEVVRVLGSNRQATKEPGEPNHASQSGGSSVWYSWQAPRSARFAIGLNTADSPAFLLAVYRGTSLATLAGVGATADGWSFSFSATAGTTYWFAVDDRSGRQGLFPLSLQPTPGNDDWANALPITNLSQPAPATNLAATAEPGEPGATSASSPSVWWAWTAPCSGRLTLTWTTGGPYTDPQLALYTGSSVSSLSPVPGTQAAVAWGVTNLICDVTGRSTYSIAARGRWNPEWSIGFQMAFTPLPANDRFADAIVLEGLDTTVTVDNTLATAEAGEPAHAGFAPARSVWYAWTPPVNGPVQFSSTVAQALAVYSGETVSNLTLIGASRYSWVSFQAQRGVTYHVALDGGNGPLSLHLAFTPSPANDNFADRLPLTGIQAQVDGTNLGATREADDPWFNWFSRRRSVWFSWTAPADAPVRLRCDGLRTLAVFTGTNLSALTIVASILSRTLVFEALAGTTYQIEVDGYDSADAGFSLDLRMIKAHLVSPVHGASYPEPASLTLLAATTDVTGAVRRVDFLAGTNLLAVVTNRPFRLQWSDVPAGRYSLWVQATDEFGAVTKSEPIAIAVTPRNDDFARRSLLSGTQATFTGTNFLATSEPWEPRPDGASGRSLWWTWTAPENGQVTIDVTDLTPSNAPASVPSLEPLGVSAPAAAGAGGRSVEPKLVDWSGGGEELVPSPCVSAYTGDALTNLVAQGSNLQQSWGFAFFAHRFSFYVTAGEVCQIALDGRFYWAGVGGVHLQFSPLPPPANDLFVARILLAGTAIDLGGTTLFATRELGEPSHGSNAVWYAWTAPASGTVRARAYRGTYSDPMAVALPVSIYAGATLSNLLLCASGAGELSFHALQGLTYQIAVAECATPGDFRFTLDGPPAAPGLDPSPSVRPTGAGFQLQVAGVVGQSFVVQASTNLVDWETLALDTVLGADTKYLDQQAALFPRRFYRVLPLEAVFSPTRLAQTAISLPATGRIVVRISGPAGQPFSLRASSDLIHWTEIARGWVTDEFVDFLQDEGPGWSARFYQVVPWP